MPKFGKVIINALYGKPRLPYKGRIIFTFQCKTWLDTAHWQFIQRGTDITPMNDAAIDLDSMELYLTLQNKEGLIILPLHIGEPLDPIEYQQRRLASGIEAVSSSGTVKESDNSSDIQTEQ